MEPVIRCGKITVPYTLVASSRTVEPPTKATPGSIGWDLHARIEEGAILIQPGQIIVIGTGIKAAVPKGYAMLILQRSGWSKNTYLRIANAPGLIDSDYRGEIAIIVEHIGPDDSPPVEVRHGDRLAQAIFVPIVKPDWVQMDSLDDTERGAGGFGHTGR